MITQSLFFITEVIIEKLLVFLFIIKVIIERLLVFLFLSALGSRGRTYG